MTYDDQTPRHHRDHRDRQDRGGPLLLAAAVVFTVLFVLAMRWVAERNRPSGDRRDESAPVLATDVVTPLLTILG